MHDDRTGDETNTARPEGEAPRLASASEPSSFSEWQLDTRHIGRRILLYERLDSTNTVAASMAHDPAHDGLVIQAKEQAQGRGQHGRTWTCPPGAGVLLSVLLFPPPSLRRPVLLAAWAAVSVCETIRQCLGIAARIKWPNDVLVHDRKVCGILIEQCRGTVAGVGLNVRQPAEVFAAAGLPQAGSLAMFAERELDVREVAGLLLRQMDEEYDRLRREDLRSLESNWVRYLGLLGQRVHVECHNGDHQGRLVDLHWDGVALETPGQSDLVLAPELVRHIYPLPAEHVRSHASDGW